MRGRLHTLKCDLKVKNSMVDFSAADRRTAVLLLYVGSPSSPLQVCNDTVKPSEHIKVVGT